MSLVPEASRVGTMVLTAPMTCAVSSTESRSDMMESLSGMVTDAPPKLGERMRGLMTSRSSVSQREYV